MSSSSSSRSGTYSFNKPRMSSVGQWFQTSRKNPESGRSATEPAPAPASESKEVKPVETLKSEHSLPRKNVVHHNTLTKPKRALIRPVSTSAPNLLIGAPNALARRPLLNNPACPVLTSSSSISYDWEPTSNPIVSNPGQSCVESLRSMKDRGNAAETQNDFFSSFNNLSINWFKRDNKQNIDQMLEEEDRADSLQEERERIRRKYRSPKNPVIFCHGLLGFDSIQLGTSFAPLQVSHWRGIKEVLEANGTEVLITRVPATSSISTRAQVLLEQISKVYSGKEVHLIAHSMGGLDCRYLTTHLKKPFKVLSITTIATPHRGSIFADHFIKTIGHQRMPSVMSLLDLLPNGGGDGKAFESLTIESMRRFNEETPDVPDVKYFSWGATYEPGLIDTWRYPYTVVSATEGPNDGLVSVESSKWGTYLGTLENVSHLDLVGWINTARYKWAEFTGRKIAFKPATFYLGVADHLARVVEERGDESNAVIRNETIEGVDTSPVSKSNNS